ncbi:segregation and condensation protein A [Treponema endosymbiont of Eucomonympha sp.]|uniref:segregation and condensation protein A n=1 Tax=Treponema endosymbiont of Eucomonympha sp. TaxID=1580831 RepID=UPI0007519E93|nr:segregation/condensation protein A [Treponema endosymbiont of Eucomonympha sp.]
MLELFEPQPEAAGRLREGRTFVLDAFEGPLDLLLYLIKTNDLNIYDIPLASLTAQFLQYLDGAADDLAGMSEFYALAADLLYIKSKMLLPAEVSPDDEELSDPRQELVDQLIEYQKFRKLASLLGEAEGGADWGFGRHDGWKALPLGEAEHWEQADAEGVLRSMRRIFRQLSASYTSGEIPNLFEEIPLAEKLALLGRLLESRGECFLSDLIVREGSLLDVVCAFMAVLEAVKFKTASIWQSRSFGDIKIRPYQAA